jgi:Zn finger protein HypA/HybF involved in hydrogenase expression
MIQDTTKQKRATSKTYIARVESYNANPTRCKSCGTIFPYKSRHKMFCDHSCSAKFNNLGITRNQPRNPNKCICGNTLESGRSKYCSMDCLNKDYLNKVITGVISPTPNTLRKIIINIRGYRCENCGSSEWLGEKLQLELHHIDGDNSNGDFDNLSLLCPNCHSITNNYKGKNKGNGRVSRRKNVPITQ